MNSAVLKSAAKATLALPFKVPPQNFLTLRQAAGVAGLSESSIEALYDAGKLTGNTHPSITGDGGKTKERRATKRVLSVALAAYLVKTGDYTDESLADILVGCLPYLPAATRARISIELRRIDGGGGGQRAEDGGRGTGPSTQLGAAGAAGRRAHG